MTRPRASRGRAPRARWRRLAAAAAGLAAVLALAPGPRAGGPFLVNGLGQPLAWDPAVPVTYRMDQGALGLLSAAQAQALTRASFDVWGGVAGADISFAAGPLLPCDVTAANFSACGPAGAQIDIFAGDGVSPVVFDTDGTLVDALLGIGARNSVIGFAAVVDGTFQPPVVTDAVAVFNGRFFDGVSTVSPPNPESPSQDAFQAVFVHEIGHWVNLDHSQVNLAFWADGDADNDKFLPTMFPASSDDDAQLLTLNPDDVAALSLLYPPPGAAAGTARLSGRVLLPDATTPFQGANLVLRETSDPFMRAYSAVSGALYFPAPPAGVSQVEFGGPPPLDLLGAFTFGGVAPGTYTLEVEEIEPLFVEASSVGPFPTPVFVPGPNEFWSGDAESSDPATDPPGLAKELVLAAGDLRAGVDLVLNEPLPPALLLAVDDQPFDPAVPSGPTALIELDLVSGAILRRIPAPAPNSAFQEGLAYAAPRGTLFFTDGASASRLIYELNPVDGSVMNSFSWPATAQRIDGLAFLNGPGQPPGGVLYALDSDADRILGLSPDDGSPKGFDITSSSNLFGGLGGTWEDLFVNTFGDLIVHLRPSQPSPVVNFFTKPSLRQFNPSLQTPGLDRFLVGLGYDGESLYATSITAPRFRIWRISPRHATDPGALTPRLDVIASIPDPTPIRFGGFSGADVALRGDLDGSLRVDGFDLAVLGRAFGSTSGNPGYRASADLARDGDVDGVDLAILATYFGRSQVPAGP